ncbi:MAG TPA: hypothetical protein VMS16_03970 [Mycobacterium sp.]|jgi:hypothetical protein|nr:hypothetical protein [Mycobacterium sp.]
MPLLKAGQTGGDRHGDWILAITLPPTFDAIAATAALDPARRH